jgi:uncharacterized protein YxjI
MEGLFMSQNKSEEQHEANQVDPSPVQTGAKRYQFHQKIASIGKDYWIENEHGEQVYKIDGKAVTWNKTFYFEDAHGNKLAKIKKSILTLKETMEISAPDGEQLALVKKDVFTPLKEHFVVNVKDGPDLEVHGNLLDHEYTIGDDQNKVAQVSKKWLNIRDSYSVSIEPGQDDVIILAVVLCIDEMTHATR